MTTRCVRTSASTQGTTAHSVRNDRMNLRTDHALRENERVNARNEPSYSELMALLLEETGRPAAV
jgi:hypothetical protein